MALAFSGMMLSEVRLNCELGFALSVGVLLDTFVVRPLLAPSLLVLGGSLNYWPQDLPEADRSLEELEEWLCGPPPDCGRPFPGGASGGGAGGAPSPAAGARLLRMAGDV